MGSLDLVEMHDLRGWYCRGLTAERKGEGNDKYYYKRRNKGSFKSGITLNEEETRFYRKQIAEILVSVPHGA